jgi:hypothetical protein
MIEISFLFMNSCFLVTFLQKSGQYLTAAADWGG